MTTFCRYCNQENPPLNHKDNCPKFILGLWKDWKGSGKIKIQLNKMEETKK